MKYFNFILIFTLALALSACSIVTDKGRFVDISSNNRFKCENKKNVVFYISNIKNIYFDPFSDNNYLAYYNEMVKKSFENSNCFDSVEISPVQLEKNLNNSIYIDLKIKNNSTLIPVITPILSLAIPMPYKYNVNIDADVYYDNKEKHYEIEDSIGNMKWSIAILIAPFATNPDAYLYKKQKDLLDVLVLRMKNDAILDVK